MRGFEEKLRHSNCGKQYDERLRDPASSVRRCTCWERLLLCSGSRSTSFCRRSRTRTLLVIALCWQLSLVAFDFVVQTGVFQAETPFRSRQLCNGSTVKRNQTIENEGSPSANRHQGNGHWLSLFASEDDRILVYSAYLLKDGETGEWLSRIIGVSGLDSKVDVSCSFLWEVESVAKEKHRSGNGPITSERRILQEHANYPFTACYFECYLFPQSQNESNFSEPSTEQSDLVLPSHVQIWVSTKNPKQDERVDMKLTLLEPGHETVQGSSIIDKSRIALCVKPLHSNAFASSSANLIEHIELHHLLGVSKGFYYLQSPSQPALDILGHYANSDQAVLIDWRGLGGVNVRTHGLIAALNECILRTRAEGFTHTVIVDFDEFIIPRIHSTYPEMLREVDSMKRMRTNTSSSVQHSSHSKLNLTHAVTGHPTTLRQSPYAAFVFRNIFFYKAWSSDALAANGIPEHQRKLINSELVTMSKTMREANPGQFGVRSKYIVKPEFVVEAGNHFVWECEKGKRNLYVKHTVAMSHHYRASCPSDKPQCLKSKKATADRTAHRFIGKLASRVADKCSAIFGGPCP